MGHDLISFVAGYFLGSIPTAFLLVKERAGIDIQQAGSGNVGAFNVFYVTRSKLLAITVGVLDGLKGFVITFGTLHLLGEPASVGMAGMLGAIVGHTYPVWLGFKGGRGLATAAGGLFAVGVSYTIVWCVSWLLLNRWKKDIVTANVLSSIVTPIMLSLSPTAWLKPLTFSPVEVGEYQLFAWVLSGLLLLSHREIVHRLIKNRRHIS
ncbi:MAG TPA: glycerol-3-phosphate acyltransferase [Bacteroidota bacterium]|nr:glycerol-3-phosphate acyltransferase [Bacteroidota bacterium]